MTAQQERSRAYYERNRETMIAKSIAYQKANKERVNAKNKAWRDEHPEKAKASIVNYCRENKEKKNERNREWKSANPATVNEMTALRRAQKKNATPKWANRFFMREAYDLAKRRTAATGFKWEVDHILPLQHPDFCGLHVEYNLQVIPASVNRSKGNRVINHG